MKYTKEQLAIFIGQKLKAVRNSQNLSQTALSKKTRISQNFLSNIENGTVSLDAYDLLVLADVLRVKPEDFIPQDILEHFDTEELVTTWEDETYIYTQRRRKK